MTPKIRQTIYAIGTIATSLLGLLSLWKVLDPATAGFVNAGLAGLLSLLGAGAAGTAAVITGKQRHDGTFDPVPELDPADKIITGINEVLKQKADADAAIDRVKDIVVSQVRDVPVLGPLASDALEQILK